MYRAIRWNKKKQEFKHMTESTINIVHMPPPPPESEKNYGILIFQ